MNLPVLTSVLILVVCITFFNIRTTNQRKEKLDEYWEKERKANFIRKKSLEDLEYISIPFASFPMQVATEDEIIQNCLKDLRSLENEKIVNFTGISNTDLKLTYGTANITALSQYDQNYTLFIRTLQEWGNRLHELGYDAESRTVLEYAINSRTDISSTYYLLASIYDSMGETTKIKHLILVANTLQTVMKNPIVRTLKESYPDID